MVAPSLHVWVLFIGVRGSQSQHLVPYGPVAQRAALGMLPCGQEGGPGGWWPLAGATGHPPLLSRGVVPWLILCSRGLDSCILILNG